jgi:virginiamycin B lyase
MKPSYGQRRSWSGAACIVALSALSFLGSTVAFPAMATENRAARSSVIELDGSALPQGIVGSEVAATVWFSAAQRSAIGEIDVASNTVGYIALGHGARPRALALCPNGRLYVLDPALNVIHEVQPATEEVKRHPMPNGQNADLSGIVCTSANLVLFTGYNGWLGKLDAETGAIVLVEALGGRGPAHMTLAPSGSVWFSAYASSQIVRVDPASLKQDAFSMPAGLQGPKGIGVDSSGRIWVSAFRSARLARFDPRRRTWDAWPLGDGARPHALHVDAAGSVLVTDVGRDRLLRFDASSGEGVSAANLSERGQARAMTRLGDTLFISETAVDRIRTVDLRAAPSN